MTENQGAAVNFEWATETSLPELNISSLNLNHRFPSPLHPPAEHKAKLYFIAFPTSYLVEIGFSWVTYLLSKARNCLDMKRGDLRLSLTTLKPDI